MAEYKVVDAEELDNGLKSVADTIRAKGGTTSSLTFPEGFKSAIRSIPQEGGSGGSGIIDVTELPTENIDENAVYRVTETIQTEKTEAYRVSGGYVTSVGDIMADSGIPASNIHKYVVDELPTDMKSSDVESFTELNFYLLRTDGKVYMHIAGYGVITLAIMFFQDPSYDKGFTDNVYAETEDGIYTTAESYKQVEKYFVHENGEWKEITAHVNSVTPHGLNNVEVLSGDYNTEELVITQADNFSIIDISEKIRNDKIISTPIKIDLLVLSRYITEHYWVDFDETWFKDENGELISSLRRGAFAHALINSIALPDGITTIPYECFCNSTFDYSFTLILPKTIQRIENGAFRYSQLISIQFNEGLEVIEGQAFYETSLGEVTLPKSLQTITAEAFAFCTSLNTVTFNSKPEIISTYTNALFNGCTYLSTINVPWSEGEVEGAPWGANNATINYNYTEG